MTNDRCLSCKNYVSGLVCIAFPDGIPKEILLGDNDHTKPLKNQDFPIVFEPKKTSLN